MGWLYSPPVQTLCFSFPITLITLTSTNPGYLKVVAQVGYPQLDLLTSRLDFGLVRLNGSESRVLTIHNTSLTCATDWALTEQVLPHKAHRTKVGGAGGDWGRAGLGQGGQGGPGWGLGSVGLG